MGSNSIERNEIVELWNRCGVSLDGSGMGVCVWGNSGGGGGRRIQSNVQSILFDSLSSHLVSSQINKTMGNSACPQQRQQQRQPSRRGRRNGIECGVSCATAVQLSSTRCVFVWSFDSIRFAFCRGTGRSWPRTVCQNGSQRGHRDRSGRWFHRRWPGVPAVVPSLSETEFLLVRCDGLALVKNGLSVLACSRFCKTTHFF
mmetsp:Transcript_14787/g.33352  ORF Transcript_14787/g.33352 Transcript_14787/m.33352 type:complete len:201 (+) Transcript_14787:1-603(+)